MRERPNRLAWKASVGKLTGGSNPPPSAVVAPGIVVGVTATTDELMALAIAEARLAIDHGDVPVGALVVRGGEVIASRHNERELSGDPTAHAEMLALRDAADRLGSWRLLDCTLFVTLEPCPMCAGAALNSRVESVVYGADDPKAGACGSLYNLAADPRLNHEFEVVPRVRAGESAALLIEFFADRR